MTLIKIARGGIAPYFGGKARLVGRIRQLIESHPHTCYAEPFVGMGGVFFARRERARSEWLNDANGDITNLFKCLDRHLNPLVDLLQYKLHSRADFEALKRADPAGMTDLERAVRFVALQYMSYGAKLINRSFRRSTTGAAQFAPDRLRERFRLLSDRLSGVGIENVDFEEFILRFDRPSTLFYIDPPYVGREKEYLADYSGQDHERLAHILRDVSGSWILSINDAPEIREMYDRYRIDDVDVAYSVGSTKGRRYTELLISNFVST